MESNHTAQLEKFKELVEDVRICMLTTRAADGALSARPMGHVKIEDDGSLWYFTNEYSDKIKEISQDNEVFITYASPSKNSYVAFNAKATLSDDREKMKELWTPMMKAWFPEGLDDPKILLIKADPEEAEFWDGPSNKIVLMFGMIKAAITGKFTQGDHGTLNV